MLKDKELKSKQQEINKIEADWSSAQKEIIKSKLSLSDAETDKLAREQSKNKLLAQCMENGRKHKYIAPLSSQTDVKKCYERIKKLNEQDQLFKFKKALFSESAGVQSKQSRETSEEPLGDFIWPLEEEEFVITLQEDGWSLGTV